VVRRITWGDAAFLLFVAGAMVATVIGTGAITYPRLRVGLTAMVAILLTVAWLGRRPGVLGPPADEWPARLTRVGGQLLVGIGALGVVLSLRATDNPVAKGDEGLPILATVLTIYLFAFVAVTARRSPAGARTLSTGAAIGAGAAGVWLGLVLLLPPIPQSAGAALVAVAGAAGFAAVQIGRGPGGRIGQATLAALCAGTVAALLIVELLIVALRFGPEIWIPDLAPAALTPAAGMAQSRVEAEDSYLAVLLLGALLAAVLAVTATARRRRARLDLG
jgi:hypothetical protein